MLLEIIGVLLLLFFIYGIHQFVIDKLKYRLPPGPRPLPFLGNLLSMSEKDKIWIAFRDFGRQFGPINTFYLGQYRMAILNGAELINDAINVRGKQFVDRPSSFMPGFEDFPTGLLFASGEQWLRTRRFSLKALRDFGMGKMAIVERIQDEVSFLVNEIDENARHGPIATQRLMTNAVSNVICALVLGKRLEYGDPQFVAFHDVITRVITGEKISQKIHLYAIPFLRHFVQLQQAKDSWEMVAFMENWLKKTMEEHRRDFNKDNIRDFPDLFIQAELTEDALDPREFTILMNDMFNAGTETTATALNWTMLYLTKDLEIQRKCHEAIDAVIESDRLPTLNDRPELVYIDAVMCEVLRHATIVPLALFHAVLDETGAIGGFDIAPKTIIIYNVWAVHRDAAYWKDPEVFRPERWIDENGKLLSHSSHFMPFGTGPRICIGELLARVEYFVFLVALLHRFSFRLAPDYENISTDDGVAGITYASPKYELVVTKRQ